VALFIKDFDRGRESRPLNFLCARYSYCVIFSSTDCL
jgi:hypothetical protein